MSQEYAHPERASLLVTVNPDFLKKVQKMSDETGRDLNALMNEILKIGTGVIERRVANGSNEIHIHFQDKCIKIEEYIDGMPVTLIDNLPAAA